MTELTEGAYWRCRCLMAEAERDELQAKWAVARATERLHAALRDAGLDPAVTYRWYDNAHSVSVVDGSRD